jgi:hypothetical protein
MTLACLRISGLTICGKTPKMKSSPAILKVWQMILTLTISGFQSAVF